MATSDCGKPLISLKEPSLAASDADTTEVERRKHKTKCQQPFPFMALPPELRLQVYESLFQDALNDTVQKRTYAFPRGGIRRRISHRAALRHHIKAAMAILHTCGTVRGEAAAIAFQTADTYIKSTLSSLKQLGVDCESHDHDSVGRVERSAGDENIFERYRELMQRYADLCVDHDALRIVKESVYGRRHGESLKMLAED